MCTIIVLREVRPDFPLVIAANRDEFYARDATGPQLLAERPRAVGGIDLRSGGTWMGVTDNGFFAGITNQRTFRPPEPQHRSRGPLVRQALELADRHQVRAMLEALDPATISPFNLLYGDAGGLELAYCRTEAERVDIVEVPRGLSVLPNDRLGSPEFPKVARARQLIEPAVEAPWPELRGSLRATLADHHIPRDLELGPLPPDAPFGRELVRQLHAICIHTEHYGTRSATLVALTPGAVAHYEFADGPMCRADFVDHTALVGG